MCYQSYYYPRERPCPTCGHCPTCGRRASPWYQLYWPSETTGLASPTVPDLGEIKITYTGSEG